MDWQTHTSHSAPWNAVLGLKPTRTCTSVPAGGFQRPHTEVLQQLCAFRLSTNHSSFTDMIDRSAL